VVPTNGDMPGRLLVFLNFLDCFLVVFLVGLPGADDSEALVGGRLFGSAATTGFSTSEGSVVAKVEAESEFLESCSISESSEDFSCDAFEASDTFEPSVAFEILLGACDRRPERFPAFEVDELFDFLEELLLARFCFFGVPAGFGKFTIIAFKCSP